MKRVYLLKGLACPNCSAMIEKDAGELNGVHASSVNLMKQTLTVESDDPAEFLLKNITEIVHNHEPDVEVSELNPDEHASAGETGSGDEARLLTVRLVIGAVVCGVGIVCTVFLHAPLYVELAFLVAAYLILGGDVVCRAVVNISKGRVFDEHFLMSVSTIGAFVIGEYPEAVAVMLFYQVGELFETLAVRRSARSISRLMDLRPDSATVLRNGERIEVSPETVSVGETIVVKPGGKIPLDGVVLEGDSMLDTRALTGESVPRTAHPGDT
ncbi:MAG: cation transporter, partial [Lentisphaeria bacterium]|nr:cation transporter [Lentisphaeria bacterium]